MNRFLFIFSDIDECTVGNDNCHHKATCHNNVGSFYCSCNSGYTGNGEHCQGTLYVQSAYETNFFIALCERTFKIVVQVLLYFCITLLC